MTKLEGQCPPHSCLNRKALASSQVLPFQTKLLERLGQSVNAHTRSCVLSEHAMTRIHNEM